MTKPAFFNVDEKEQAVLLKAFERGKAFELSFRQKPIDIHAATAVVVALRGGRLGGVALERILVTTSENLKLPKTKIMMNLGNPEEAFSLSKIPNDGVGLAGSP